jgi:uracil-DNA glycosylase
MLSDHKTQAAGIASSLVDWWKMAGVEYLVEDVAVDWFAPKEAETAPPAAATAAPTRISEPERIITRPEISSSDWPADIAALQTAITSGLPLPGNTYGGKSAAPVGPVNPQLMIIGDIPDIEEIETGSFGAGGVGRLLINMVSAIGYNLADCYLSALATTRPATGELPEDDCSDLAAFAQHQINLVNPQRLLILGSAACRALLGADLMDARDVKSNINHIVGKKAATPTFHPRTLLARPMLKAQAWKDLQMVAKKDAL